MRTVGAGEGSLGQPTERMGMPEWEEKQSVPKEEVVMVTPPLGLEQQECSERLGGIVDASVGDEIGIEGNEGNEVPELRACENRNADVLGLPGRRLQDCYQFGV
jgi:hypothetical protein